MTPLAEKLAAPLTMAMFAKKEHFLEEVLSQRAEAAVALRETAPELAHRLAQPLTMAKFVRAQDLHARAFAERAEAATLLAAA